MKKILVTGGAGFIGSNFIKYMLSYHNDYMLTNLDLLTYAGNLDNLKTIEDNPHYNFVQGDIADRNLVKELFAHFNFDCVINFAAESHVDRSIEDPGLFVHTNVTGTQVLLEAAKNNWQLGKDESGPKYRPEVRFIQISTDEVYGELKEKGQFDENSSLAPNNPYAASKAGADMFVRSYQKTYNLPTNIIRSTNNYGPYQYPEKLIPVVVISALQEKKIPVYGDGQQIRDWLYVRDNCRAIAAVLEKGKQGEIYNVAGNQEKTNLEVLRFILEKLEKPKELINYVADRPGHDRRYALDGSKIRTQLAWEVDYSFAEGMEETVSWYLENRDWWEEKFYSE